MTSVVVLAEAGDRKFFDNLNDRISSTFSPITIWNGEAKSHGDTAGLLLCDSGSLRCIHMSPRIILFGGRGWHELPKADAEQTVVIVDSCDEAQLRQVSGWGLPAVTCGLGARDTITLSSMRGDSAVINLQRSITCFDGSVAEPQEFPIRLSAPTDHYLLMAVASIYILTGNADRLITQTDA